MNETQTPLIYARIAAIMKDTAAISKAQKNQQQGFMFRGIDDVMNELHNLFAKNEVFILQEVQSFTTENRPTRNGGLQTFTRATIKFRYMTTDGSYIETVNVGEAMDTADKGMNKAMSIALKYSLLQLFLIPTVEKKDPDFDTPEETPYFDMALQEINAAQSIQTLEAVYKNYTHLQKDKNFLSALTARKTILKNGIV